MKDGDHNIFGWFLLVVWVVMVWRCWGGFIGCCGSGFAGCRSKVGGGGYGGGGSRCGSGIGGGIGYSGWCSG